MKYKHWLFLFLLFTTIVEAAITYQVEFIGINDKEILSTLKGVSELISLQTKPTRSINALRYRADSDVTRMIKALKSYGYYDSHITTEISHVANKIIVSIIIDKGIRYTLGHYHLLTTPCDASIPLYIYNKEISLDDLDLKLGDPAITEEILKARLLLLTKLSCYGYPLATIEKQDVEVNADTKEMDVDVCVDTGPECHFGPTTMIGLSSVKPAFVAKKIRWKEEELYNPIPVELTQKRLLASNLFTSVLISNENKLNEEQMLPMKMHFTESKHKNISIGASFATYDGLGASFNWSNFNIRGMGELLSLDVDVSKRSNYIVGTYRKPDFMRIEQDFTLQTQIIRRKFYAYLSFIYSLMGYVDTIISDEIATSYGIRSEYNSITHSGNNGKFVLISTPLFIKHSTANSLLNPTKGLTIIYKPTPFASVGNNKSVFFKQNIICETYWPLTKKDKVVLALRAQLGSIIGPGVYHLPLTKLFLGGSDTNLRGYRYRSVSPRNRKNDPIGGRSAIYISVEPRLRVTQTIGIVPFLDLGTVDTTQLPNISKKWYKSVGIGLRYFTFFGPLRLDVGFPLNKRRGIDPKFRFYISIGQTF
jgi:translocation and assembly module TamA